ncbi:hypothetical protein [Cryobacterium tagatosivorans]|uniref:SRPBCC domain-containing protein n=1 Tax=Cryobacterium tagatosivorans TaxID=1259199 RepID=A0A4R8UGS5_9MICO|nr:hypothetical protein [Cryobacterium tagatosivorans]TFB52246.1 hypothetical protein E3O23_06925 [Cryobacterium tagatosivorans]
MTAQHIATSTTTINAPTGRVWSVLTDPDAIKEFLEGKAGATRLTLSQDNNASAEDAEHSNGMWDSLVASVKAIAERG